MQPENGHSLDRGAILFDSTDTTRDSMIDRNTE